MMTTREELSSSTMLSRSLEQLYHWFHQYTLSCLLLWYAVAKVVGKYSKGTSQPRLHI